MQQLPVTQQPQAKSPMGLECLHARMVMKWHARDKNTVGGVEKHRFWSGVDEEEPGEDGCLSRGELGDGLGALRHGMLGQLAG